MATFEAGQRIGGRYRLIRKLGEGAMGVVWSARNESTNRDFALKLMLPETATRSGRMQRFLKEAKRAGGLRHRSIVEVYDLGIIEEPPFAGSPYLVMELLDGEPLDVVLGRLGKLPSGTTLRIVSDVARALEVAHKQGLVHRDLKPGNLFLHHTLEGAVVPKLLDFGISKLIGRDEDQPLGKPSTGEHDVTVVGTVLGSPAYMSPEQAAAEPDVDARSDIWSLGVILYRSLSGTLPFLGKKFEDIARAIHKTEPPPLHTLVAGLPREVSALVHRCLAKDRAERFQSARTLADALDEMLVSHVLPTLELSRVISLAATEPHPSDRHRTASLGRPPTFPSSPPPRDESTTIPTQATRSLAPSIDVAPPAETRELAPSVTHNDGGVPAGTIAAHTVEEPSTEPQRMRRTPRVWAAAALAVVAMSIGLIWRGLASSESPAAASSASAPTLAPESSNRAESTSTSASQTPAAAALAAAPSVTTSPSPRPSAKPAAPLTRPSPPKITSAPAPAPAPAPSANPAHEGITKAGF